MEHDQDRLRLYLTHRTALIDYAAPIVGCRARAEDVVQEAYLRFVPHTGERAPLDRPVSYLYRIVRNLAFDWTRRLSAETRRAAAQAVIDPVAAVASPEEAALHRDELRRVYAALSEVPERSRRAFEMHRFGGLTFHQIAARLDVSVATAHRLVRDMLIHVANRLKPPEA
jgi:RNA polymerase sigma-70 factor (ECF subfamily)